MAQKSVLIWLLVLGSLQFTRADLWGNAANLNLGSKREVYPSNLQPAASPGQDPASSAGSGTSAGGNDITGASPLVCFEYMIKLYKTLMQAYDTLNELYLTVPQTMEDVQRCMLPPYTTAEKTELCIQETFQALRSKKTDLLTSLSDIMPKVADDVQVLEKCIESETPP